MFEGPVENDEEDIIFFRSGVGRVMTSQDVEQAKDRVADLLHS